jgi:hypothetical protein
MPSHGALTMLSLLNNYSCRLVASPSPSVQLCLCLVAGWLQVVSALLLQLWTPSQLQEEVHSLLWWELHVRWQQGSWG